jgi:hypothetical protein
MQTSSHSLRENPNEWLAIIARLPVASGRSVIGNIGAPVNGIGSVCVWECLGAGRRHQGPPRRAGARRRD